jgi:hypothetical protein
MSLKTGASTQVFNPWDCAGISGGAGDKTTACPPTANCGSVSCEPLGGVVSRQAATWRERYEGAIL